MAVERYSYRSSAFQDGTWEEYWYDALGRRVLTRTRREPTSPYDATVSGPLCVSSTAPICRSFTERVWWDGDQSLVEERTPEGTSDVSNSGTVGNIHALVLDEPLAVITTSPSAETRIINYNWRGQGMGSVYPSGHGADVSTGFAIAAIDWPASTQAQTYFTPSLDAAATDNNPKKWLGTFIQNGMGTTGMLYRRNRYFDTNTGRFTQEDPIGIAGGVNQYGFANGDPVNFSDPFGLWPDILGIASLTGRAMWQESLLANSLDLVIGSIGGGGAATALEQESGAIVRAARARGSELSRNLAESGLARQAGVAAHHIVAKGAQAAEPARQILMSAGVRIDEAANGVFLPATKGYSGRAMNHLSLHTREYYAAVNRIMRDVQTRQDALEALNAIRDALLNGTFHR